MRLISFKEQDQTRLGVETPQGIVDIAKADPSLPKDLLNYLQQREYFEKRLQEIIAKPPEHAILREPILRCAPLAHPGKILCIGVNYKDHAAEMKRVPSEQPEVFAKFSNTLIGDGQSIQKPVQSDMLDFEAELAVVIGKRAKNIKESQALSYVAGYMVFNDVTVRDYQKRTLQWTLGKNFDTHGPCGPALVTADEIVDPQNLAIKLLVNGEVMQNGNTKDMIFSVAKLIEILSSIMTLEIGDVISTGTPAGVGAGRTPPRWLKVGDKVVVEIEGIGVLSNCVI